MRIVSRAEAKSKGSKRFYTGVPCARGHVSERIVSNQACVECVHFRTKIYRAKDPEKSRRASREYREANAEKRRAYFKKRYAEHGSRLRQDRRDRRSKNADVEKAREKIYRLNNPEKFRVKEQARWLADPKKNKVRQMLWRQNNPEAWAAIQHTYRASRLSAEGSFTEADIKTIASEQNGNCKYCNRSDVPLTIDHIVPLARGGTNWPNNLCLCCKSCNSKKGKKDLSAWLHQITAAQAAT